MRKSKKKKIIIIITRKQISLNIKVEFVETDKYKVEPMHTK